MVKGEHGMVNGPSQAAIGRALDLSPASITKLKGQGMPVDSVESAQAWRIARQNIAARKPEPASARPLTPPSADMIRAHAVPMDHPDLGEEPDGTRDEARTRREIAEANIAEMKEGELRGDLIRMASVKATLAAVFATTRDALLQIPARLAPLLAADADPANVQNTLHAEIHQALVTLAGAPGRIGETESVVE
jgi:phage terminase Nu1 subunit (DNA packaging protein)